MCHPCAEQTPCAPQFMYVVLLKWSTKKERSASPPAKGKAAAAAAAEPAAAAAAEAAAAAGGEESDGDCEFFGDAVADDGDEDAEGEAVAAAPAGAPATPKLALRPWVWLAPQLIQLGYQMDWRILPAAAYGAANARLVRATWAAQSGCGAGLSMCPHPAPACSPAHRARRMPCSAAGFLLRSVDTSCLSRRRPSTTWILRLQVRPSSCLHPRIALPPNASRRRSCHAMTSTAPPRPALQTAVRLIRRDDRLNNSLGEEGSVKQLVVWPQVRCACCVPCCARCAPCCTPCCAPCPCCPAVLAGAVTAGAGLREVGICYARCGIPAPISHLPPPRACPSGAPAVVPHGARGDC